jgi:hypothetical protein
MWALIGHVGSQPPTTDSRSNPTPEGFESLSKGSRSNPPSNCTRAHQRYAKMFTKQKEILKWRMVEINKAGTGNKASTPLSLTPM